MIKLRMNLYKNCMLNDNYQVVFSHAKMQNTMTVFEYYLSSLTKKTYDLDDVFYENEGEIVLERELVDSDIYDFNYIKFIQYNNEVVEFIRYCFIKSIYVKNGCVYIEYKEDIWSSYADKIKGINPSYLCRSRIKSYINFTPTLKMLPKDYEGNEKIEIQPIWSTASVNSVYVLIELQLYNLVGGTENKQIRQSQLFFMSIDGNDNYYITYNIALRYIERFIAEMEVGTINNYNFQIGKIYLLPIGFTDNFNYLLHNVSYNFTLPSTPSESVVTLKFTQLDVVSTALDTGLEIKTGTIQNNYKNISFGTFTNQISIVNNGTDFDYSIRMYRTNTNIIFQLCALNQIVDITDNFIYEPPITSILAEDFAQRKIAVAFEGYKNQMKTAQTRMSFFGNFFDLNNAIGNIMVGANTGQYGGLMNQGRKIQGTVEDVVNKISFIIPTLEEQEKTIYAPKYSNTKGNIVNNYNIANYVYGLFLFKVIPDNQEFVKKCVDNFGYVVFEFIDDYSKLDIDTNYVEDYISDGCYYNTIRFLNANVYGSFTNEIAEILNSILENGVKIMYANNFNDTYTDDLLN